MLKYYQDLLKSLNDYLFLNEYLSDPLLERLKEVGYFCGMDYASKDIYNFSEYISRYDHSLNVALLTYHLTKDQTQSIAGLYHDISTPCFSHVIDYMNKDYLIQESTEYKTKDILLKDNYLKELLKKDNIDIKDIINFKKYSIVDNNRPKLCADRIDGVILNSMGWVKNLRKEDIDNILGDITVETNEDNNKEIAFKTYEVALRVKKLNDCINQEMHSNYDIYMMQLLADIVKKALNDNLFSLNDLYTKTENQIINNLINTSNEVIKDMLNLFLNIKKENIGLTNINVKDRNLSPLVRKKRI